LRAADGGDYAAAGPAGVGGHRSGRVRGTPERAGRWVVTDDVMLPAVRELLGTVPGKVDELRYVFGKSEVVFTAPGDGTVVKVSVRER